MNNRAYKDGNGGVYEDDDDPGPWGPGATPPCPICPADKPHRVVPNEGALGGFICDGCGTVLTPEARGDNRRKRELWESETKPKPPVKPEPRVVKHRRTA